MNLQKKTLYVGLKLYPSPENFTRTRFAWFATNCKFAFGITITCKTVYGYLVFIKLGWIVIFFLYILFLNKIRLTMATNKVSANQIVVKIRRKIKHNIFFLNPNFALSIGFKIWIGGGYFGQFFYDALKV